MFFLTKTSEVKTGKVNYDPRRGRLSERREESKIPGGERSWGGRIAGNLAGSIAGSIAGRSIGNLAGSVAGSLAGSIAGRIAGRIAGAQPGVTKNEKRLSGMQATETMNMEFRTEILKPGMPEILKSTF